MREVCVGRKEPDHLGPRHWQRSSLFRMEKGFQRRYQEPEVL
jgi:hypothetical protein